MTPRKESMVSGYIYTLITITGIVCEHEIQNLTVEQPE